MTVPGKIPPIPTPLAQRMRHAKMTLLPGLVFVASVMVIAMLWRDRVTPVPLGGPAGGMIADWNSQQEWAGLRVERFQDVNAGEPIANLMLADPKLVD